MLDGLLLALVLVLSVLAGLYIYGNRADQVHLSIESPSGTWVYDLETERKIEIPGDLANTVIKIEDGKARIIDSPCTNKTCITAPPISHKGEWNACLPNKVMIRIEGETKDNQFDAIAN